MLSVLFIIYMLQKTVYADVTTEEIEFLNELPLEKLIRLKSSLQELVTDNYENVTAPTPVYTESFGAQAMAIQAPPIKRKDYEEVEHKKDSNSKVTNIFSMSVTTLAFLAFGGYLLCLVVQAMKANQNNNGTTNPANPTFFVSSGIKKRPQPQISSYGRKKRSERDLYSFQQIDWPPEELFSALLQLCEGYVKWNQNNNELNSIH